MADVLTSLRQLKEVMSYFEWRNIISFSYDIFTHRSANNIE